jgi:putative hydrolase of the HAD superfamily
MMKAVILDMYGVIIKDPGGNYVPFVKRTFPELERDEIYVPWLKGNVGEISSLQLFKELGYEGDLSATQKEYLETIEIDEAFYEFARTIKESYKIGLLSNDLSEWSRYLRDKYQLNDYFDVITVSGDVKIKKPDERIFKLTVDKLGVAASDCIYVDDRRYNLAAAKSLGMETILFNTRQVEYDGNTVNSFQELAEMLARL